MNLDYLIFIVLALNTILSMGILLRNTKAKINQLYAAFVTILDIWIITNFLENEPSIVGLENLELFLRLDFVFAIFFFYIWLRFCEVFVESKLASPKYRWVDRTFLAASILFAPLSLFTPTIITNVEFYDGVIHFTSGMIWPVYALFILFAQIGGLVILFLGMRRTKREKYMLRHRQISFVFYGFLVSFTISTVINLFLQTFFPISLELSRFALYGMTFMVVSTAYAMVKQRLFEFKFIVVRAVVFLFLTIIIAAIYSTILFGGIIFLFDSMIDTDLIITGIILATIIALSFHSLHRLIASWTDKLFFKGQYNVEHLLSRLTTIMAENIDFEFMTENILSILTKEMRISKAAFLSVDKNKTIKIKGIGYNHHKYTITELKPLLQKVRKSQTMKNHAKSHHFIILEELDEGAAKELFRKLDIAIAIPIRIKKEETVILIVGPKLSGEMYYQKDIDLLAIFAPEAAIAIQNTKAYAEIKKLNEKLEQRVKERTVQIHQLQEKQNQMMIDISHSLQTPLTVMKGELDFLKKRMPDDKKIKVFEKTINDVSHFIYNLLDLARLETTHDNIKKKQVNLSQLLEEQIEYFEVLAQDKGVTIVSNIKNNITISAAKGKIEELVVGLVSNAMKYMQEKDEKKIFIELRKINNSTQLTVQDTGIGISKKDLPYIFDRFYRSESNRELNMEGSGLGLAICKKIVEKHNGTIDVESELGKGTKFTIKFPITS